MRREINYDNIIEEVLKRTNLELDEIQIYEILDRDEELKKSVRINGIGDTVEREWFLGEMAKWLIGRDWPCNGDAHEDPDFFKDLIEAARDRGIPYIK